MYEAEPVIAWGRPNGARASRVVPTVLVMSPDGGPFVSLTLLFLRIMVGLVFVSSGYADLRHPDERSKSIELPKNATLFIGWAELLGGTAVIAGVLTQLAAAGLILIMLGALQKKIFVWRTGFWGKDGLGWNYELILTSMLLVIISTGGGRFGLAFP